MSNTLYPIPQGDPRHYQYKKLRTADEILAMIRNRRIPTHDEAGFVILDSAVAQYNRLFKHKKKRIIRKKRKAIYAIFREDMSDVISIVATKKEALALLKKQQIRYSQFHKRINIMPATAARGIKPIMPVVPGLTVIRVPVKGGKRNIDSDKYVSPQDPDFPKFRVAVKRCDSCPKSKDPNAHYCPCSMIARIKDSGPKWIFWTRHEIRMYMDRRKRQKDVKITLTMDDLI